MGRDKRVAQALSAIYRTEQRFGAVHLIEVLRGKAGQRISRWGHDKLNVFGIGADLNEPAWRNVFRQLIALGFVQVDHSAHGALLLTEASRPVLKGDQQVEMRPIVAAGRKKKSAPRTIDNEELTIAEMALLERLKEWRNNEARTQNVPAYVILNNNSPNKIAKTPPH